MPDIVQSIESYLNVIIGLALAKTALGELLKERRTGFRWIWLAMIAVGVVWALLYITDILFTLRTIMGTGTIRSAILVTLSLLLGIALQLRIPREK